MAKAVEKKIFKKEEADAVFKNMLFTTDYGKISDADLVIEAAFESLDVKNKIFNQCQEVCPKTAILASNSSHMPPEEIFQKMKDKSRCLVLHYFFPAERNMLLEVVPGKDTDPVLIEYVMKFYEFIGKAAIQVKSRYGFAVNPFFEGNFLAAALAVEKGLASVKQADAIFQKTLGLGVGPFTAHNLAGGNPLRQHGLNLYTSIIMPWFRSPKILDDQVKSGKPWEAPAKGESVEYSQEVYEAVSNRAMGAYFGIACEIVESGVAAIGDVDLALEVGLVMTPPFQMMNKVGVKKALQLAMQLGQRLTEISRGNPPHFGLGQPRWCFRFGCNPGVGLQRDKAGRDGLVPNVLRPHSSLSHLHLHAQAAQHLPCLDTRRSR